MRRQSMILLCLLLLPFSARAGNDATAKKAARFTPEEQRTIDHALRIERALVRVVQRVRPCSVSIENLQSPKSGGPPRLVGAGSGVIISRRGYILTNEHVVENADAIEIVLCDHRRLPAKLVGNDPRGDVALLKINAPALHPTNPRHADSDDLVPGQWVVALGNPFFLARDGSPVVSLGVISGLGRVLGGKFFYGDAIQHDAAINPGNSGGPLFDMHGNLLGLNGRIAPSFAGAAEGPSNSGVGFTVPIDQIRNFFEPMMQGKRALHGDQLLGVTVKTDVGRNGKPDGAVITSVEKGSPAAEGPYGGLEKGDVIWRITLSGRYHDIRTRYDFLRLMSPLAEGVRVTLHVRRGHRRLIFPRIRLVAERKKR